MATKPKTAKCTGFTSRQLSTINHLALVEAEDCIRLSLSSRRWGRVRNCDELALDAAEIALAARRGMLAEIERQLA